ncbi:MAG: hypothetical protein AAGE89_03835 [Pseudomonadota bacterium]
MSEDRELRKPDNETAIHRRAQGDQQEQLYKDQEGEQTLRQSNSHHIRYLDLALAFKTRMMLLPTP